MVMVTCDWCFQRQDSERRRCLRCGHNPNRLRAECDCRHCETLRAHAATAELHRLTVDRLSGDDEADVEHEARMAMRRRAG